MKLMTPYRNLLLEKFLELAKHPYSRICEPGPMKVYGTAAITRQLTRELP